MKQIKLACIFLLLLCVPTAIAQSHELSQNASQQREPQNYIGLQYKNLPPELSTFGGRMLTDISVEPSYVVSWVVDANCQELPCPTGTLSMLWLERFLEHDSAGQPSFEVIDVIQLPNLPQDFSQYLQIGGGCTINGVKDPEIIAIVKYDPQQETFTDIHHAWRANLKTQKLEIIPPQTVTCENLAYGI